MLIISSKQGKEKSLLAGDPWSYLSAIEKGDGKPQERNKPSAAAIVQSSSRRFLAGCMPPGEDHQPAAQAAQGLMWVMTGGGHRWTRPVA